MRAIRYRVRHWLVAVLLSVAAPGIAAQTPYSAGFQRLAVKDPLSGHPMSAAWFYPGTFSDTPLTSIGPYDIAARRAGAIAPGRYPLVVISHGNAGSMWGHHDLATYLAQQGYSVITLTHPGDNYQDQSGVAATSTLYGRPRQISAAISAALQNRAVAPYIDSSKIAVVGFSAGGETGLLLAGASVSPARFAAYCQHQQQPLCASKGTIRHDRPGLTPQADSRINALVLMAPVTVRLASASLQTLPVPALIFSGDKDEEVSYQENALALAKNLPAHARLKIIKDAGHFIFLSPCSRQMAVLSPALCNDAPALDRVKVHQEINGEIADFLRQVWTHPAPNPR